MRGNRMFMIMEVNENFSSTRKQGRCRQSKGPGVGKPHVEVPRPLPDAKPGEKSDADGESFQIGLRAGVGRQTSG